MGSVETVQFIRKPLYVDAVRITGVNFDEVATWCQGEIQQDEPSDEKGPGKKFIRVRVHNPKNPRQTKAYVGDWLLYTERGYKVYTNKAFHDSFDEVMTEDSPNGNGVKVIMGSEGVPGFTFNEVVERLRDGRIQFVPVIQSEPETEETKV
jgi:hypothetical protein